MQFITTSILPDIQYAHVVVTAWFEKGCHMVDNLAKLPGLPEYVHPECGGLAGRVSPSPYRKLRDSIERGKTVIESELFWNALRAMCDIVNDAPESGTLLPLFPITLVPAFTLRPPVMHESKVREFIDDVFKAHSFAKNLDIVFLLDFGPRGMRASNLCPIIESAAKTADYEGSCILVLPND